MSVSHQTSSPHNFLALPNELLHQIYLNLFTNLTVHPIQPLKHSHAHKVNQLCQRCQQHPRHTTHFTTAFLPLLTCKQIYNEAKALFYSTLTLHISEPAHLASMPKTPAPLRNLITTLSLTVHLCDVLRQSWKVALSTLPTTFPHLTHLHITNHMRPPTSYDHLTDAIFLTSPLVRLPPHLQTPPGLLLEFAYAQEETMFNSPLLGAITTADSLDEHEAVIRDLLSDEEFRMASWRSGDWDVLVQRLLGVARAHEESWMEGLQRRRWGGLTLREVQERVASEAGAGAGAGADDGEGGTDADADADGDESD